MSRRSGWTKIQEIGVRGAQRRLERRLARATRSAPAEARGIGVLRRRVDREVVLADVTVVASRLLQRVDHRRIGLHAHPDAQPVAIDRRHDRALVGLPRFLLDSDASVTSCQSSASRLAGRAVVARIRCPEPGHHVFDQLRRHGRAANGIGVGEQITLEVGRRWSRS